MRILLSESHQGAGDDVARRLSCVGHAVTACSGGPHCSPTSDRSCALAANEIDVVVDVRDRPVPFSQTEQPLLCAVLARVPTVICGPVVDGHGPWLHADVRCEPPGVVDAVDRAVDLTSRAARRRVRQAVADVLRPYALPGPAHVDVTTRAGLADVRLTFEHPLPVSVCEQLRAAIRASLTALTRHWAFTRIQIDDQVATAAPSPPSRVAS